MSWCLPKVIPIEYGPWRTDSREFVPLDVVRARNRACKGLIQSTGELAVSSGALLMCIMPNAVVILRRECGTRGSNIGLAILPMRNSMCICLNS